MYRFKVRLVAALLAFGTGILVISFWMARNHSLAMSSNELLVPQTKEIELTKDTVITLDRSACYGYCPEYTLTISGDGSVVFVLRMNGKEVRKVTSIISQEKLKEIIKEFNKADYFSLKDKYINQEDDGCPEYWTDQPDVNTSIKTNGRIKSISHYHGCRENRGRTIYPKGLTELERKIDEIVNTKQWNPWMR